ncbi:MAG: POTRA domain-containing protein [Burkholderiales bacterium]
MPAPAVAAPVAEPRFDIDGFNVRGATLITSEELRLMLAPFIGKSKNFGDVQKALEALERSYTDKGYSAVQVILPEQQIDGGEIEFDVIEAKIGRIVVEGNKYFDEANIRASLPLLQPGKAPNIFHIFETASDTGSQACSLLRPRICSEDVPPLRWVISTANRVIRTGNGVARH